MSKEMSFLSHVGELRSHLVRAIIAIVIAAFAIGLNIEWVMSHIIFGPTKPDFLTFRAVNYFSRMFSGTDTIIMPPSFPIQVRKLFEQFNMMMSISIFGGILLAFPYLIWEVWRFIKPALRPAERKNSIFIINGTWVLFVLGALCGYFLIMPFVINFGYFFHISTDIRVDIDLSSYISLLIQIVMGMAVVFLFPMLVYILTSLGLLTPTFLRTYRKHAIVVIMAVAAILTPPDVLSMIICCIPLLILYEICIIMSALMFRKMKKTELVKVD
jgi:sec-independent protein translocase protein TatC